MSHFVRTFNGKRIRKISLKRGIPIVTVETIIRDYYEDIVEGLKRGERQVIDGLVSLTPTKNLDTGEITARGRVSSALNKRLNVGNSMDLDKDEEDFE